MRAVFTSHGPKLAMILVKERNFYLHCPDPVINHTINTLPLSRDVVTGDGEAWPVSGQSLSPDIINQSHYKLCQS